MSLLRIEGLTISFPDRDGRPVPVVRDLSLVMGREKVGIVGESGSGKSLTARAIMGVLPHRASVRAERLEFDGRDLRALGPRDWRRLRGDRIGMILQDPRHALNPVLSVGDQIVESIRLGAANAGIRVSRRTANERAREVLEAVEIRDPDRVMGLYPHEVSGGMGQRVMIAISFVRRPDLLIADEITSALDVTVRARVLDVLDGIIGDRAMGLIFISHDLQLVARFCDRVLVMYAGRVVEEIAARDLSQARHPYTQGLLRCIPRIDGPQAPLPVLEREAAWAGGTP